MQQYSSLWTVHSPPITVPLGFGRPLVEALFLSRPNRFLIEAELDGAIVFAHLADRGRLKDTLVPGARLLLASHNGIGRKTQFQAVAAWRAVSGQGLGVSIDSWAPELRPLTPDPGEFLVSLDTHLPNRLIEAALQAGALPPFAGYPNIRREVTVGTSRFDFQLSDGVYRCTVEVKSAGDVQGGIATFPDAPTERGRRHLEELAVLARAGERAAVVFVAQGAAEAVAMNREVDPHFAATLQRVAAQAVEIYAYACPLSPNGITFGSEIRVLLEQ